MNEIREFIRDIFDSCRIFIRCGEGRAYYINKFIKYSDVLILLVADHYPDEYEDFSKMISDMIKTLKDLEVIS